MSFLELHLTPVSGGIAIGVLAVILIAAYRAGALLGRCRGYDIGRAAGYLDGRRSERQSRE